VSLAQIGPAAAAKATFAQLETAALHTAGAVPPPNTVELAAILHLVLAHPAAPPVRVPLAPADRDRLTPAVKVPAVARPVSHALIPSAAPNMATAEPALLIARTAASLRLAGALNDHVPTRVW